MDMQCNITPDGLLQHAPKSLDVGCGIDDMRRQGSPARKGQKLAGQVLALMNGLFDHIERTALLCCLRRRLEFAPRASNDPQHVVEVVVAAARTFPQRLEPLRLLERILRRLPASRLLVEAPRSSQRHAN